MRDIFNGAASIGEDAPVWSEIPCPWGRTLTVDEDDDASPGDAITEAVENYERLMEGLEGMREAWGGYGMLGEEFDEFRERQQVETVRAEAAQREAFDLELEQASILQQPMRISKPVALRRRFIN